MDGLTQYVTEYLSRLGLSPEMYGEYVRRLQDAAMVPDMEDPAPAQQSPMPMAQPPPMPQQGNAGLAWGMAPQTLAPPEGAEDPDMEYLQRARLHQALAGEGLRGLLGGR